MSAIIRVALSHKELRIEPGQRGELALTIQNLSQIVDQFLLEVEGLDDDWVTLAPPRISLFPQDGGQVMVGIHPPDTARAGSYDFAVKAVSRENPIEWARVRAAVEVTPVFQFDLSLSPQRKSAVAGQATFGVQLTNPGNVDLTLGLSAADPEEGCTYRFDPPQVTVAAGGSAEVGLTVTPKRPAQGQGKLYSFTVRAAPVDARQRARTASGQLECKPQVVSLRLNLWPPRRSTVGAGSFQVQLVNAGNTDLNLVLEGTDPEEACAYKFEPPQVALRAGESQEASLTVAPIGRVAADRARLHDFMVRAVPQGAPHEAVQVSGQLECRPRVVALDISLWPSRRSAGGEGSFEVHLENRGDADLSVELEGTDSGRACRYTFKPRQVTLKPGESRQISLTVTPRGGPPAGQPRLYDFTVRAVPHGAPQKAAQVSGQFECLPVTVSYALRLVPDKQKVRKQGEFGVRLTNRTEAAVSLELAAEDQEAACDYRFRTSRVKLAPGEDQTISLTVRPRKKPALGKDKTYTFSVRAAPEGAPHLAKVTKGELKVDPARAFGASQGVRFGVVMAVVVALSLLTSAGSGSDPLEFLWAGFLAYFFIEVILMVLLWLFW